MPPNPSIQSLARECAEELNQPPAGIELNTPEYLEYCARMIATKLSPRFEELEKSGNVLAMNIKEYMDCQCIMGAVRLMQEDGDKQCLDKLPKPKEVMTMILDARREVNLSLENWKAISQAIA